MRLQDKLAGWIDDQPLVRWIDLRVPPWLQVVMIAILGSFLAFFLATLLGAPDLRESGMLR